MDKIIRYAFLVTLLCAGLAGCGGGDFDEDEEKGTQPVDCKATPERCV